MGDKAKDKLISSKRAKEAMADRLTSTGMPLSLKDIYDILDGLEEVPQKTTYDIEKVIEELEKESFVDDVEDFTDHLCLIEYKTAVEIVKRGGIEQ